MDCKLKFNNILILHQGMSQKGPYFDFSATIYKSMVYENSYRVLLKQLLPNKSKLSQKSSSKFFPPPGFILSFYNLWEHHKSFKTMICNTSSTIQHHSKPFYESRVGDILMLRRLDGKTWLVCILNRLNVSFIWSMI